MKHEEAFATAQRIAIIASDTDCPEHDVSVRSAANVRIALSGRFAAVDIFAFNRLLPKHLTNWCPDVVLPVAHGAGETGDLQKLLQSDGYPFVGSDATASATCWDNDAANRAWFAASKRPESCRVPPYMIISKGEDVRARLSKFLIAFTMVIVKPARAGSSQGISFCTAPSYAKLTPEELLRASGKPVSEYRFECLEIAIAKAFSYDSHVVIQQAVAGMEVTVGVIEDPEPRALPVIEIVTPKSQWFDYAHKYSSGKSEHIIPARLSARTLESLARAAVSIHKTLGCRDLSRIDFIVQVDKDSKPDDSTIWLLEANTLPGLSLIHI